MSKRILSLAGYLLRSLTFSLAGILFALMTLVFYLVFFDPRQNTPDLDYFALVIGLFGMALTFLVTLTVSGRANQAVHFPLLVRLPSRVEYLVSVLLAAMTFAGLWQLVLALAAAVLSGPDLTLRAAMEIPPLWIAGNILAAVVALHASDLVAAGWSRVLVFSAIALLIYGQNLVDPVGRWFSQWMNRLGNALLGRGWESLSSPLFALGDWLSGNGIERLGEIIGLVFWPFRAIVAAMTEGRFSEAQSLAPAALLLYATVLFLLASRFLASKDLFLAE